MWRAHPYTDLAGHYDVWQQSHSDIQTNAPPLIKASVSNETPSVSLSLKLSYAHADSLLLHDRPFSPFSGYYDQDDIYLGCEYDIFSDESSSDHSSLLPSLFSTTTVGDNCHYQSQQRRPFNIVSDDPFSLPHLESDPPSMWCRRRSFPCTLAASRPSLSPPSVSPSLSSLFALETRSFGAKRMRSDETMQTDHLVSINHHANGHHRNHKRQKTQRRKSNNDFHSLRSSVRQDLTANEPFDIYSLTSSPSSPMIESIALEYC